MGRFACGRRCACGVLAVIRPDVLLLPVRPESTRSVNAFWFLGGNLEFFRCFFEN